MAQAATHDNGKVLLARPGIGFTAGVVQRSDLRFSRIVVDRPALIVLRQGTKTLQSARGRWSVRGGEAIAIAVFNTHATKTSSATFTVGALGRGKTFVDAMGVVPSALTVPAGGEVSVTLPAQSAAVFVLR